MEGEVKKSGWIGVLALALLGSIAGIGYLAPANDRNIILLTGLGLGTLFLFALRR